MPRKVFDRLGTSAGRGRPPRDVLKGFRTNFIPGWLVVTELALFLMMAFDYAASILKDMRFKLLLHGLGTAWGCRATDGPRRWRQ